MVAVLPWDDCLQPRSRPLNPNHTTSNVRTRQQSTPPAWWIDFQHCWCCVLWLFVQKNVRFCLVCWTQMKCNCDICGWKFSSVVESCPTLCDPMNYSTLGLPVPHQLLDSTQTHVHRVSDTIQPSHPLSSPSAPALNLSQHQGLFKWVSSSHQVAKVLEFQPQHQSFQWIPRTDLL